MGFSRKYEHSYYLSMKNLGSEEHLKDRFRFHRTGYSPRRIPIKIPWGVGQYFY